MPNYTVALVGHPTSNFTLTSRTYEAAVRICTDGEPCDLFPIAIQNSDIRYPSASGNIAAIPQTYDLSFYGCDAENDAGAVLSSSRGGPQVEPNDCDIEEMESLRGTPVPVDECLCCREYTFQWTAEVIDGNTIAEDVANDTCPDILISSFVTEKRLECAEFLGFYGKAPCEELEFPFVVFEEDNITTESGEAGDATARMCLTNAFSAYKTAMDAASVVFEAEKNTASAFGGVIEQVQLSAAELAYREARTAAFKAFKTAHAACIADNPDLKTCWPMQAGDCMAPMSPNGSPIELYENVTEKIIQIIHLATSHDFNFFAAFEGKVNCGYWSVAVPCANFAEIFPSGTIRLNKVDASTVTFNEVEMWRRQYEFHWRRDGFDEYVPLEGVDRAVCEGAPEGTFFRDDEGVCQAGTFGPDSCLDNCENIPGKATIIDSFGNGIREPMNLTIQGQPGCRQDLPLYTGWETVNCADFNLLPIPQFENPDFIRDNLTGGPPGDPPDEDCTNLLAGTTRTIYYKDVNTTYTWLCQCDPGCDWVNV